MATTGAPRTSKHPDRPGTHKGSPTAVRLGVQWGYPFSLVRRLLLAFVGLLAFCFAGAYILAQPGDPVDILVHLVPAALAILLSMYVVEIVGVTERPLPPLGIEALFTSIATSCLVMAVGYALVPTYAPSTALVCAAPVAAAIGAWLHSRWKDTRGAGDEIVRAALFARDHADAVRSMAELADAPGVRVKALILPDGAGPQAPVAGLPPTSPKQAVTRLREDELELFVVGDVPRAELRPVLAACAGAGCIVERVDDLVATVHGRVNLTDGGDVDLLNRITRHANRFSAQRSFDILAVLLLLPIALPLSLLVALAVKLTSRGPAIFTQVRVGLWGKEFKICKFRTMRVDAERETGPVWARDGDPRVTPVGRFLRGTRLDEIPQLWNVLKGEMSLVGPRPERPFFVRSLKEKIPLYEARHSVRPGLTGWAQIRYNYGATDEDAQIKLAYELFYILNRSGTFYFTCVLETLKVLLFRRGAR